MRVRLISYSKNGRDTAERIAGALISSGHDCRRYALPKYQGKGDEPLMVKGPEWAGEAFREADALIFCCASGIAVRAIAPWVRDKTRDPAVIVIDDQGDLLHLLTVSFIDNPTIQLVRTSSDLDAVNQALGLEDYFIIVNRNCSCLHKLINYM